MKTCRKALSLVLCLCMIFSVMAAGLTAFAADKTAAVTELEEKINAYSGNMDTATPSDEDLAGYNELVAAYQALDQAQVESIDPFLMSKLYQLAVDRGYRTSTESSSTNKRKDAGAKALEWLTPNPSYWAAARTLAETLADKEKTVDDKLTAFLAADLNTRLWSGLWYASYEYFYYDLTDTRADDGLKKLFDAIVDEEEAENPFEMERPSYPGSVPDPADYAGGENDPQYIADLAAYSEKDKAYSEYYVADYQWDAANNKAAFARLAEKMPEIASLLEIADQMVATVEFYQEGGEETEAIAQAEAVLAAVDTLPIYVKPFITAGTSIYWGAYLVDNGDGTWDYEYETLGKYYTTCTDITNLKLVYEFVAVLDTIETPYTRADIEKAKEAYNQLSSSLRKLIPADAQAKYEAIMASIGPDEPSMEIPDISGLSSTSVKYPTLLSKWSVKNSTAKLEEILLSLVDLPQLVQGLYTNATVATVIQFLYPTLGGLSSLIAATPADLVGDLTEDKFAGAREAIEAAMATVGENGEPVGDTLEAWQYVVFDNGDMGFQDGDREGFLDAVSALFRPLSILTMAIDLENDINTTSGTYTYGAYEDLVPVFETLGLRGVLSSHEYTLYVNAAPSNAQMDARIRPILVPIFNLLDDLAADPMSTILNLLPRLGMLLKDDMLDTQIQKLADKVGFITLPEFSLKTGDLFDMIAPMLSSIELKAAETDAAGNVITPAVTLSLNLDKENFIQFINEVAGCGTYMVSESISRENAYRVDIKPDTTDVYVTLFRYLYTEITSDENMASIVAVIDAMDMNPFVSLMIKMVLALVDSVSANGALRTVTYALPVVNLVVKVVQFFSKLFA